MCWVFVTDIWIVVVLTLMLKFIHSIEIFCGFQAFVVSIICLRNKYASR